MDQLFALAGSLFIQIQNPNATKSNAVSLIVAAPNISDDVITLSGTASAATGKDIVVVDPTTAGVSVPGNDLDLNVGALGQFVAASNTCTLGGSAIPLQRPATGASTADICLFSQSGLGPPKALGSSQILGLLGPVGWGRALSYLPTRL